MRIWFTCCVLGVSMLLWAGKGTYAQTEKQERYRSYKSKSAVSDKKGLLTEADQLKLSNPNAALDKVQEALALSIAEGDLTTELKSYLLLGEINEGIAAWSLAKDAYEKAHELANSKKGISPEFIKSVVGLGNSHLHLQNLDAAVQYFLQGVQLTRGQQQNQLRLSLSEAYYQQQKYDGALAAINEISITNRLDGTFQTLVEIQRAKIETQLNGNAKLGNIYSNSLNKAQSGSVVEPEVSQSLQKTKEEIAGTYRSRKQYDDEIELRKNAIEYNQQVENFAEVTKDKVEIGKTLEAKGEDSKALKELEEAGKIAESISDANEKSNAFLLLAEAYEKNGQTANALRTYRKYASSIAQQLRETKRMQASRDTIIAKQKNIERISSDVSLGKEQDSLQEATVYRQQLIIYGLLLIVIIVAIAAFFIYRNAKAKHLANQLLALKSLRSQMNPHFIFNALNSVNHFIAEQDERTANKFLSEFSALMRAVLENSGQDFITLNAEVEMLSLYLKLEHYRFRDKFDYELQIDPGIVTETIELPPMLLQPYIENAVWHGLRYKEGRGKLSVSIAPKNGDIVVTISDNGIGRERSKQLKTDNQRKHKSTGLQNIGQRLAILNDVYRTHYRVAIDDMPNNTGTVVTIFLPTTNSIAA